MSVAMQPGGCVALLVSVGRVSKHTLAFSVLCLVFNKHLTAAFDILLAYLSLTTCSTAWSLTSTTQTLSLGM